MDRLPCSSPSQQQSDGMLGIRALGTICLAVMALGAAEGAVYEQKVACVGDPEFTYDLILPATYATEPDRRFPTLFISSPGGNPNIGAYRSWADQRGFIVVAVNNSRNGPWSVILRAQDLVLSSLSDRGIRRHPAYSFAAGFSGAGAASERFALRFPDQFSGVHISGHSGTGDTLPEHIAVSFYAGRKDETHPIDSVERAIRRYRQAGNPLRTEIHDGGHVSAKPPTIMKEVEWMFWQTMLTHPTIGRAGQPEALALIAAEREGVIALADTEAAMQRLVVMLENPTLVASPEGQATVDAWGTLLQGRLEGAEEAFDRFWLIQLASERPWFVRCDRDLRRELGTELRTLLREQTVRNEHTAYQAYQRAAEIEEQANHQRAYDKAAAAYAAIAGRFAETRYGAIAAEAAKRLGR